MPLESPTVRDGDAGFIGFASRMNPVALPAGVLQLSENMRLDRGTAKTRKGARRLADDLLEASLPITLPFNFAPELPVVLDFLIPSDPEGLILRESYAGGIFASCVYRSPLYNVPGECIILAGADRAYVWRDTSDDVLVDENGNIITDHAGNPLAPVMLQSELLYPSGETVEPTDTVSLLQAFDRVYLLREASPVAAGYTPLNVSGVSISGTTATVACSGHNYTVGMRVRLEGGTVAAFDKHEYDIVATPTPNSFTVTVPAGTSPVSSLSVRRVKAPLFWNGEQSTNFEKSPGGVPDEGPTYRRLHSVGWATYVNNRLVVPDGPDTVAISDVLEPNLYDPFWQSFRANQGSNDFLVAVQPWVEGSFLVFMRKSIWLATVNQFASVDGASFAVDGPISNLQLLTDEVGCAARKSIQTAGQFVYFLSDAGVYRLDARLDLKLRGDTRPLSDEISDQLADINWEYAYNAVGLWYDNRYFIAIPQGEYAENVTLFTYSALNEAWGTKDFYGFGVDNLLVSNYEGQRRLFIPNRAGKLFLMDDIEEGDQAPDGTIEFITPVPGRIKTRRFGFGSMTAKRFHRVLADVVLPQGAEVRVTADAYNPDKSEVLVPGLANDSGADEDYSLKLPIRRKGHFLDITIETLSGRPEIRVLSVEAAGPSRPPTETRTVA